MRDEIMRLADAADARAKWGRWSATTPAQDSEGTSCLLELIALTLRALARTDHVEDKLGMVAEGYHVERAVGGILHKAGWRGEHDDDWLNLRSVLPEIAATIAATPAPDHSAGVGGVVSSRKRRVFVDMDGVIVDFDAYKIANNMTGDEVKRTPGAYLAMPAIPGAIEAVRSVIGMGFDVWIATKPPTGVPYAYSDKAAWIMEHLPELKRKIIITHDKGLLGDARDFLCDDRPHKANCERFAGSLLRFVDGYHWPQALDDLRAALAQPADAG